MNPQTKRACVVALLWVCVLAAGTFTIGWFLSFSVLGKGKIAQPRYTQEERSIQLEATHSYMQLAISNVFLLNGAAIVGILTLMGHLYATDSESRSFPTEKLSALMLPAMTCYCFGVAVSCFLGFTTYYKILYLLDDLKDNILGLNAALMHLSVWSFVVGSRNAAMGFLSLSGEAESPEKEA